MKSAGKWSSNCVVPSCGAWYWANGIEPESNQTSITSGTRRIGSPHSAQGKVASSTYGRCGSVRSVPASSFSSCRDPMASGVGVVAAPHRQRRAPVALARQRPVDVVLEPVTKAAVLDVLGRPVDGLVGGEQAVLDLARGDVPRRLGVIQQGRVAAPAVGIGVLERLGPEDATARAEVLDQVGIGILDVPAGVGADAVVVGAVEPDRVDHVEPVLLAEAEVVLAEGDRGMDQARAVGGGDEVGEQHGVAAGAVLGCRDERERRVVGDALELGAREAVQDVRPFAFPDHAFDQRLGDHVDLVLIFHANVSQFRVDGDRGVRHERPRSRGPDQELIPRFYGLVTGRHREADVYRRVDDVLIDAGLPELVARERDLVARAVGDDLELLVEETLVVDRLERPPDRLDVLRVERPVGVAEVDPEPDALRHRVPVLDVAENHLAAPGVELGDPEPLDVGLGGEAQLGLERELHRKAVAVPAALALDEVPAHRPVAGEDVLEHAREHVVDSRRPVGSGWPFVKAPAGRVLPASYRFREHLALAPALEHALLELGERDSRIDRTVGLGHRARF